MYNVLIAEDEMLVRIGLKNSVNWQNYNMEVIADVANGQKAWEVILREKPDVLITDIKMPIINGLELVLKLRENNFKTKVIILSCVEDFKTVQEAISLGVSGYISKLAMDEKEVNILLNKIRMELDKEGNGRYINKISDKKKIKPKSEVFGDYLFYKLYTETEIDSYVRENNLRLSNERLRLCMMEVDYYQAFQEKFKDKEGHLIQNSIINVLEEILDILKTGEVIYNNNKRYCILLSFKDIYSEREVHEETNRILGRIKDVMSTYIGISVSFGVSNIKNGYSNLRELYYQSTEMLENKFFNGTGKVCFYSTNNKFINCNDIYKKVKDLLNKHKDGLGEDYFNEISNVFSSIKDLSSNYSAHVKNIFLHALNYPDVTCKNSPNYYIQQMPFVEDIINSETIDEVIAAYNAYIEVVITENKSHNLSRGVLKTLKYIEENYQKDISLKEAAALVNMRSSYLSSIFKNEIGMNFVDYIMKTRIEKAKELLVNTNMKSYEIANRTGFNDDSYFSRTFKKMTGFNPNEYRRKFFSDELINSLKEGDRN